MIFIQTVRYTRTAQSTTQNQHMAALQQAVPPGAYYQPPDTTVHPAPKQVQPPPGQVQRVP